MKYLITGRIQPERAEVHFEPISMGIGEHGHAVVSCSASQITVSLDDPDLDGYISALVRAEDIASIAVCSLGYSLGSGYSLELIQVTEEDGTPHVFGVRPGNPSDPSKNLVFDNYLDVFNRALHLSGRDIFFRLAVRDYLQAINDTSDCALYCYRAIESIKSSYVNRSGKDRWNEMHAALGTDRQSIQSAIKDYADPIRHGNWIGAKPTDIYTRWKMLELTRDILKKYLDSAQAVI